MKSIKLPSLFFTYFRIFSNGILSSNLACQLYPVHLKLNDTEWNSIRIKSALQIACCAENPSHDNKMECRNVENGVLKCRRGRR